MSTSYLFAYYTLDSQASLSSSMSIKTGLFFFLTFCCMIIPICDIINYYYVMENLKTKNQNKTKRKTGENKNKLRKMYPIIMKNFKDRNPSVQFYWLLGKGNLIFCYTGNRVGRQNNKNNPQFKPRHIEK